MAGFVFHQPGYIHKHFLQVLIEPNPMPKFICILYVNANTKLLECLLSELLSSMLTQFD